MSANKRRLVFVHITQLNGRGEAHAHCQDCHYVFCQHKRCLRFWEIPASEDQGIPCCGCDKEINWAMTEEEYAKYGLDMSREETF